MNVHDYLDCPDSEQVLSYKDKRFVTRHVSFINTTTDIDSLKYDIGVLGVPDDLNLNSFESAKQIREQLYGLAPLSNSFRIIDLGNIKSGHTFNDTCFALSEIVSLMRQNDIVILLIGGDSKFNLGSFLTFDRSQEPLNMVAIDSVINPDKVPLMAAENMKLINTDESISLFNFINIGYQTYFVEKEFIDSLNDSFYEIYRLGYVRANLQEMEPCLRDANLISFSLNSIRHSDAPGTLFSSPNGLSGEEACQLSFYAGHSNRIKSFGLYDLACGNDHHSNTAKLAAQILWYFLEGSCSSIFEEPDITPENFVKFLIHLESTNQNIAFFKSNLTNRWWMEINYPESNRNILLSCSESDYELACHQDIPDRWWRTFQRLSL
jgi:Arginase/agmatinase/formimionoglutamate hydrolase, arginase family